MTLTGFVLLYLFATVAIGVWASTRVKSTSDFALAGRSLPDRRLVREASWIS